MSVDVHHLVGEERAGEKGNEGLELCMPDFPQARRQEAFRG